MGSAYCGSRLLRRGEPPSAVEPPTPRVGNPHQRPYVLVDGNVLGGEVLRVLVPADWQTAGGVSRDSGSCATPGTVALPAGYSYAWTDNLGECIVADNPNLDPNVGSNLSWQQMPRRGQ